MKLSRKKSLVLLWSLFLLFVSVPAQAGYLLKTGTFTVVEDTLPVDLDEMVVDLDENAEHLAYVFYPELADVDINSRPILLFCVGTFGGPDMYGYRTMLESFASHGIVVIAGADINQVENDAYYARRALEWLVEANDDEQSDFYQKLDTSKIVTMGHSQGGAAAIWAALRYTDIPITATVCLMPGTGVANNASDQDPNNPEDIGCEQQWAKYEDIITPTLYVAGENDVVAWPITNVLEQYNLTTQAPAWYACHLDCGHVMLPPLMAFPLTMQKTLRAWLYFHLYEDPVAESVFTGAFWKIRSIWDPYVQDEDLESNLQRKNVE